MSPSGRAILSSRRDPFPPQRPHETPAENEDEDLEKNMISISKGSEKGNKKKSHPKGKAGQRFAGGDRAAAVTLAIRQRARRAGFVRYEGDDGRDATTSFDREDDDELVVLLGRGPRRKAGAVEEGDSVKKHSTR